MSEIRNILATRMGRAIRFNETRAKRIKTASILLLRPKLDKVRQQKIATGKLSDEEIFTTGLKRFKRHIDSVQDRFDNRKTSAELEIISAVKNTESTRKYASGAISARIMKKARSLFKGN